MGKKAKEHRKKVAKRNARVQQQKNEQLKELEKINRELLNGNQNQAYLMRGSNLNRRI